MAQKRMYGSRSGMRAWTAIVAAALVPAMAGAETLRSENLQADLTRRTVTMTSQSGDAIRGEQVYVTMRRRDGQPIGAGDLPDYVGFAEKAACRDRTVLVSLMVAADGGAGQYEVLCSSGN